MEGVGRDRLEQRPAMREIGFAAAGHHGHVGRPAADRRVEKADVALARGVGDAADRGGRVGGQIDIGAAAAQPGEDAAFGIERGGLDLGRAGQRGKHGFGGVGGLHRAVGDRSAPSAASCRHCSGPDIVHGQPVPGADQAFRDRRAHRPGTDKPYPHRAAPPPISLVSSIIGRRRRRGKGAWRAPGIAVAVQSPVVRREGVCSICKESAANARVPVVRRSCKPLKCWSSPGTGRPGISAGLQQASATAPPRTRHFEPEHNGLRIWLF